MHRRITVSALLGALVLALAAFAGSALADNGHGKSADAPGQQAKATAQSDHGSQGAKPSHTASDGSKQYGNGQSALEVANKDSSSITSSSQLSGPGSSGLHKVTICHKTGSGYVEITVDVHALGGGHTAAKGDIIPAPAGGCPTATVSSQTSGVKGAEMTKSQESSKQTESSKQSESFKAKESENETEASSESTQGENENESSSLSSNSASVSSSNTSNVAGAAVVSSSHKVTICHKTGSATNPYVEITVDESALKEGHTVAKGDIIPAPAGGCPSASSSVSNNAASNNVASNNVASNNVSSGNVSSGNVQAAAPTATPATQSGVQGATKTQVKKAAATPKAKPTSGVRGATHTMQKAPARSSGVLGAATGATLPFTGFPLWLALLAALALLGAGVLISRAGRAHG